MTTYHCKGGTISLNGKEYPLGMAILTNSDETERSPIVAPDFKGFSVTMTAILEPEAYRTLCGIFVGATLQYNLRRLHQDLGRYARWPYTN